MGHPLERRPPRVLVADDEPITRAVLEAQLEHRFTVLHHAEDADGAIALAGELRPDVALLDVEMPGGGLRATAGIREVSPETAIVILTADESRASVLRFLDAGAIAYLRKGLPAHLLAARLDEAIVAHGAFVERTQRQRRALHGQFRAAFDQAAIGMAIVALEGPEAGHVVTANAAYAAMIGREEEELVGSNLEQWTHPDDLPDGVGDPLSELARGMQDRVEFEQRYLHRDGSVISTLGSAASFVDEDDRRVAIVQALDISERKRYEGQLEYLASHDTLTGLLNRRRFEEELDREVQRARRYGGHAAVLVLDLDGFKFVNDSLGHAAGDELVRALAKAMGDAVRITDTAARTGGDEFALILPEADEGTARLVGEKLLAVVRDHGTFVRSGHHARVTTSIGITLFGGDDELTAEDLIVEADIAMYDAKAEGKDRISVYRRDEGRRRLITERADWRERLLTALDQEQFVLHAQLIAPICSHGVPRFELLLRLADGDGDLIMPVSFLYNAERFGLIQQIDHWVMTRAVALLDEHHRHGNDISLAINVSAKTLNDGRIAEHLGALLADTRIPPGRLVIELTETTAIANIERGRELAHDLRSLGCQLALDDFGAGFASFYYLKHLEFDYIKIDGEFIRRLPETLADQLVVQAVVDIARGLGVDTIAEFVQDDETLAQLERMGVGYSQGYHTGRPGPLDLVLPPLDRAAGE